MSSQDGLREDWGGVGEVTKMVNKKGRGPEGWWAGWVASSPCYTPAQTWRRSLVVVYYCVIPAPT